MSANCINLDMAMMRIFGVLCGRFNLLKPTGYVSTGWTLASTLADGMQCIPIADQNKIKKLVT